jgi:hypothetical protein
MRTLTLVFLCLCVLAEGCSKKSGVNIKGSGDPQADLRVIWLTMKDYYRKTGRVPAPSKLPDGLAEVYNYGLYPAGFSDEHSTWPIAYESKPTNGTRYVLFADGRIEQLTDNEIRETGFDPDPLTHKERTARREGEENKRMAESMKIAQEKLAQDEKDAAKQAKQKKEPEQRQQEIEKKTERRGGFDKQRTKTSPSGSPSVPGNRATEGKANSLSKATIRDSLRAKVSLESPYPQSEPGAPTDKISVQYAVMELLKQANVDYDFKKSQANVGELARRWITPKIVDQPCDTALDEILGALGLTYDIVANKVLLKPK